jgi:hypothetical protein
LRFKKKKFEVPEAGCATAKEKNPPEGGTTNNILCCSLTLIFDDGVGDLFGRRVEVA